MKIGKKEYKPKLYNVHIDITLKTQIFCKVIPLSVSVFAEDEEDAKRIASKLTLSDINIGKCKLEFDFHEYIKKHNLVGNVDNDIDLNNDNLIEKK